MPLSRIVIAIDVVEDGQFNGPTRWPRPLPYQLGFDHFEERFDRRVYVTISLAVHRHLKAVLTHELLIIVSTVLGSAICMVDATFRRLPERDGHLQRPDREVAFHSITGGPAAHPRECRSWMTAR